LGRDLLYKLKVQLLLLLGEYFCMPLIEEHVDPSVCTDSSTTGRARIAPSVRVQLKDHLHCAWRPQSSRKMERASGLLKHHPVKLAQETHLTGPKLLPLALLCLRNTPGKLGITPFESLYGHPFLTNDLTLDNEIASYLP
jgi:hypothetical protein